eukprot:1160375-Pelagomonas_calceolata.AAC.4
MLGVGGVIYIPHTLEPLKELGLDTHTATRLALKLHAHSVQYAYKLVSTRRALEKTSFTSHCQDQARATAMVTLRPETRPGQNMLNSPSLDWKEKITNNWRRKQVLERSSEVPNAKENHTVALHEKVHPIVLHHDAKCETPENTLPCSHVMFKGVCNGTRKIMLKGFKVVGSIEYSD